MTKPRQLKLQPSAKLSAMQLLAARLETAFATLLKNHAIHNLLGNADRLRIVAARAQLVDGEGGTPIPAPAAPRARTELINTVGGVTLIRRLGPKASRLLHALMINPGERIPHRDIHAYVYGTSHRWGDVRVRTLAKEVQKKLGADVIETVPGGYVFHLPGALTGSAQRGAITFADVVFDPLRRTVTRSGRPPRKVSPDQARFLQRLAETPGYAVRRSELAASAASPGRSLVPDNSLREQIKKLNDVLEADGAPRLIYHVGGWGYVLLEPFHTRGALTGSAQHGVVEFADVVFDSLDRMLIRGGLGPTGVGPGEARILQRLLETPGQPVSRSELRTVAAPPGGSPAPASALKLYIRRLRDAFGADSAPPLIHTVEGWGYVVVVP